MYLAGVKDILPDIEGSVGVSEGQNDELLIDAHDALDIHLGLLDVMCVDWTIAVVAHLAKARRRVSNNSFIQNNIWMVDSVTIQRLIIKLQVELFGTKTIWQARLHIS